MVGGLLIALASLGVFLTAQRDDGPPTTFFATAAADLEPGQQITDSDISMVPLDLPAPQSERAFAVANDLAGAYTTGPIAAGELISASAVRTNPLGDGGSENNADLVEHRRISLALDAARAVNGDLVPGDRVDLLATSGNGASSRTDVLIRSAMVLAASRPDDRFGSEGTVVITLAIEQGGQVLAAVHASETATITLVESNQAGDRLPPSFRLPGPDDRVVDTLEPSTAAAPGGGS